MESVERGMPSCSNDRFMCCLRFGHDGQGHILENEDRANIPIAKFVIGDIRPLKYQDEDDLDTTASGAAPSSDEDDVDGSSFLSMSSNRASAHSQRWSWEALAHDVSDGEEANVDLLWSRSNFRPNRHQHDISQHSGGEGNSDLTWLAFSNDGTSWETDVAMVPQAPLPSWCKHFQQCKERSLPSSEWVNTGMQCEFGPQVPSDGLTKSCLFYS